MWKIMMKSLRRKMTETKKAKELVKLLERLLEKDYLYSEENIRQMKSQLRLIKQQIVDVDKNNSKGFGA